MTAKAQAEPKAARLRRGRASSDHYNVASRQRVHREVLIDLRNEAKVYGGYGRALQIGMEILIRNPDARPKKLPAFDGEKIGYSFKIPQRTVDQIDKLAPLFESRSDLIHAAVIVLQKGAA